MAKINATKFLVYVDGNAIGSTTNASISINVDLPSTTTKDSAGWEEHLAGGGLRGATGSFEGLEDPTDTVSVTEIFDLIDSRSDFTFQLSTGEAGDDVWQGTATINQLDVDYEMEQPVGVSGGFKLNGALTRVTLT